MALIRQRSLQISKAYQAAIKSYQHQQQHHRAYSSFVTSHSRKVGSKLGNSNLKQCYSYSTKSSSPSSSSSNGFLKWYLNMLETRPFLTKGVSSSLIFAAADATSQMITLPPSGSYDSFRTLRIASYGLLIMGPSQHMWFNNLSKIFPGRDVFSTVKKIMMGQLIFGPIINSIFFSYNAALRGETKEDIVARLKRDLLPTLKNGLMYWPMCDFVMFKFIPVHLQPLVNSSFAYMWTIYLTYMASLEKVG